jgi:hypothetical protein
MPEPSGRGSREFLPSANQALRDLEEATGKPVMVMEAPELNVLATIRKAGPEDASHLLRIQGSRDRQADYLIVVECRMALRDGPGPRVVLKDKRNRREQVISACEKLPRQMTLAEARKLGSFLYDGLLLQLRSIGPGLGVDRWIREHCPDLQEPQVQVIESQITSNLGALQPSTRANFPASIYEASIAMDAAYAVFGGDLLGKPYLAVPYLSVGHGPLARRLIALAIGDPDRDGTGESESSASPTDRTIIDFARRTLGQLLLMEDETAAALPHLRAAAEVAADDPINLFTYAQALLAIEGDFPVAEADALFKQALRLAPVGELAEKIKNQQRKLADRVMRSNAQGMPRMDAVEYLISALQAYRELEPEGQKQLLAEVVALSQRGLAINDPSQKHTLRHYRDGSTVSALEAACVYYTGVQLLLPGQDAGLDLGREYALAQGMTGEEN